MKKILLYEFFNEHNILNMIAFKLLYFCFIYNLTGFNLKL